MRNLYTHLAVSFFAFIFSIDALSKINQVRIINQTTQPLYIHLGGYAPSQKIDPGTWKIFPYPFEVVPPGDANPVKVSLVLATAGGHWVTSPNGITALENPTMMLCLDYNSPDSINKAGNRQWIIKQAGGFDKNCTLTPYKQPWYVSA